ncbi:hypothetical protein [Streptomyces sp. 6N223]|uniref:hypothetical protein n=1 Tax=Streptomyces sp. 6N223 TaxID=3457412 RepID=UPI003FD30A97
MQKFGAIFPPGERVTTDGDMLRGATAVCRILVDGELAIRVEGFPKEHDYKAMANIGPGEYAVEVSDGEDVAGKYDALVWPEWVMASAPCTWEDYTEGYTVALRASYPEDDEESERVLADLIQPLMDAIVKSAPCVPYN